MTRILKYTLQDHGTSIVPMPKGARILHVADQHGAAQLWAEADDSQPHESRRIAVLFTGFDEVPEGAKYIGTAITSGGNIVRHVFEVERPAQGAE